MNLIDKCKELQNNAIDKLKLHLLNHITTEVKVGMMTDVFIDLGNSKLYHIQALASINIIDQLTLSVTPYVSQQLMDIYKGLRILEQSKHYQISLISELSCIYISLPKVTTARRQELTLEAKNNCEHARIAIRKIRSDAMHILKPYLVINSSDHKNNHEISKTEAERLKKEIDNITDDFNKQIDVILDNTQKRILTCGS